MKLIEQSKEYIHYGLKKADEAKEDFICHSRSVYKREIRGKDIPFKALLLSASGNAHGLFYPFHFYRKDLRRKLNFYFIESVSDSLAKKKQQIESFEGDLVIVSLPLRIEEEIMSKNKVLEYFQNLSRPANCQLVFFSPWDNPIIPYFDILPFVDFMLIPFTFRDASDYFQDFKGGNKFADYLSRRFGLPETSEYGYHSDIFSSKPSPDQLEKILPAWNWIFWERMIRTFSSQGFQCIRGNKRNIDIHCRSHVYSGWCKFHRLQSCEQIRALSNDYSVISDLNKVSIAQYYSELEDSKILFSPFGWGEICPKDFEAVMKGCLLVKPSVEHLNTGLSFHVPYETYVPVAWDLSDLKEKIQYYLSHSEEREKIVATAAARYEEYFANTTFLELIRSILKKICKSSSSVGGQGHLDTPFL